MEGIKETNEVAFEEVKKVGFLKKLKSLFKKSSKPGIKKTQDVKLKKPSFFRRTKKETPETVLKPSEVKPIETETLKPAENIPVEHKPINKVTKTEPMARISSKEEKQSAASEKGLVEVVKSVKLERSILGFDEEKEIVKLENMLRKTRLSFEKKLKGKVEALEKRKLEIEQTMISEAHTKKEAELKEMEAMLNKKEKEIDTIIRHHQLEREDELNKRERELITKEKEITERIEEKTDEEVKKLLIVMDELLGKLPKDVIDKFVKSEEYKLYKKVLDRYGV